VDSPKKRVADLTSHFLPFALPDEIGVFEALLATCFPQVSSPTEVTNL
jgi:hypothetical protein